MSEAGERYGPPRQSTPRRRSEYLVFGAPLIGEEEIEEVVDTLRSGWIGFGPKCLELERRFAEYTGAAHAVALNSCSAGLHLALLVAGVGLDDEVLTTPLTFVATANAIEHVGARPVFADVNPRTQNLDPDLVEAAIGPRTKAILPVHMAGRPCDMDALEGIARRHGLCLVEDAAHATEAVWRGRKIGSIGDFTAFSFYATKNMTTAEGGMITTNDTEAANRMRALRLHGLTHDAWSRYSKAGYAPYDTEVAGYKYNMTDLQASLGLHQLARLEPNLEIRERHWQAYDEGFADLPHVETPTPQGHDERHARHLYTLLLRLDRLRIGRDEFVHRLKERNIGSGIHFLPVHQHSYYRNKYRLPLGSFPHAEDIGSRTVSLPLSAKLTDDDIADVIAAVRDIVDLYGERAS